MKIVKASNGKTRITLSKKEWKEIGKTAGWMKLSQIIPDDGYADGGEAYTDEEMYDIENPDGPAIPDEEDCYVSISGPLGSRYSVSCGGKFIKEVSEHDDAFKIVRRWQNENGYYPNIWFVSDHGDHMLVDGNGNEI